MLHDLLRVLGAQIADKIHVLEPDAPVTALTALEMALYLLKFSREARDLLLPFATGVDFTGVINPGSLLHRHTAWLRYHAFELRRGN